MTDSTQPHGAYLQIGEAAEQAQLTQRTLRYYEEKGLLKPPSRMDGGFRLYSAEDIERIDRIKELKDLLGFSLAEIKEMVEAEEVKLQLRAEYRPESAVSQKKAQLVRAIEVTERQSTLIHQKVAALGEMQSRLDERLTTFRSWLDQLDEAIKAEKRPKAKANV